MHRPTLRALGVFAVALAAITCSDAPTAPGTAHGFSAARLGVAPSLSPAATHAYTSLAELGIAITQVHVVLTSAAGANVVDTTIAFPATVDSMSVELPLQIQGLEQSFTALLEMKDASGTVLFSHTQLVTARASTLPAAPTTAVVLEYVGPGHAARAVTVSPTALTLAPGVPQAVTASAVDSAGQPLAALLVTWTSSDTSIAKVVSTAAATATVTGTGRRGAVTITATTPTGIAGAARFTLLPQPAHLVIVSGNGQTGVAGHAVAQPIVLELQGLDGLPIASAAIVLTPAASVLAGASVGAAAGDTLLTTDSTGRASATLTLGRSAGAYAFQARAGALVAPAITAIATPAPAAALAIVGGDAQVDSVGRLLPQPLAVRATDEFGGTVAGTTITWTRTGGGVLGAATSLTDSAGVARVAYTLGTTVRADTILAALGSATTGTGTARLTARSISRAAFALVVVSGSGQQATVGTALAAPLVVRVVDTLGNAVIGASVAWSATPAAAALFAPATSISDSIGRASSVVTLGSAAGPFAITASVGSLRATFAVTAVAGAAARLAWLQGAPDTIAVGTPFPPVSARITDAAGNAVRTAGVKVFIHGRGASVADSTFTDSTLTDTAGVAHVAIPAYEGAIGQLTLTLAAAGLDSLTTHVIARAGAPAQLALVSGLPASAASGVAFAQPVVLQVTDAGGNAVPATATVTVSVLGAGATLGGTTSTATSADGRASFAGLAINGVAGAYRLQFAAPSLTSLVGAPITLTGGVASALQIVAGAGQSGPVSAVLPVRPAVRVVDANGNAVHSGRVIFTAHDGGSASPDTVTVDAGGTASTAWTLGSTVGTDSLVARLEGSALAPVTFVATVTAGAVARFITTVSSIAPVAGQAVSVSAQLADASGNAVRSSGHVVTWSASVAGGTFASPTATTDSNGVARASYASPTAAGVSVVLTATEGAIIGSAPALTTIAGTGSMLAFGGGGWLVSGTTASGATFAPQPVVELRDANGNPVALAGVAITAVVSSGPSAMLGGATATTDAAGHATFSSLRIAGVAGSYVLGFTASGYATLASSSVTLGAGAVARLAIGTQPPATVTAAAHFTVVVSAVDSAGNVVTSFTQPVTLDVASGTGHAGGALHDSTGAIVAPATRNAVAGIATFDKVALDSAGIGYQLVAKSTAVSGGDATTSAVAVIVGAPTHLTLSATVPTSTPSGAALATQPAVQLRDAAGNAASVAGVTITAGITAGTGTLTNASAVTNASGLATFAGLSVAGPVGSVTLVFSSAGLASVTTPPVAIGAGAPGQLVLQTAPTATLASGAVFIQPPVIQLQDASGNTAPVIGVSVTASISSGTGTLLGATTGTSDALGRVTFTGLGIKGTIGSFTLTFGASGITPTTASVTLTAGAPAAIVAAAGDGQSGTRAALAAIAPKAVVHDAEGNAVAGASVVFTAVTPSDSISAGTLGRSATVVTNAQGEAALLAWKLGTTPFDTVRASVGTYSVVFSATSVVGAATHFVVVRGGGQSDTVTRSLGLQVVIEARDANEQAVAGVPLVINYNGDGSQGYIRLDGVNYDCDCTPVDSVRTDSTGRAALGWTLSARAKVDTIFVENDLIAAMPITVTALPGAPASLLFDAPDGLDDDAGNTLNPFRVIVTDVGGVDTLRVNGNITLELQRVGLACDGACPPPSGATGLTASVTNGVATFSGVTIPAPANGLYFFASYDLAPSATGYSEEFDISPLGPHFVVVTPFTTNVVAGTAVQIQLRSQDAHGTTLPNQSIVAYRGDFDGSVDLSGGGPAGYRDSSTTDSNGLITLTWLMPPSPQSALRVQVNAGAGSANTLYLQANAVAGPPAELTTNLESGLDDDVNDSLNSFEVYVADAAGNRVSGLDGTLTISLAGGDPGATLSGPTTVSITNGVAEVSGLTINRVGAGYRLLFSANGGGWTGATDFFDISPAGVASIDSLLVVGRPQFVLAPNGTRTIQLRALGDGGSPVVNQHVLVHSYNPGVCWFNSPGVDRGSAFTDASGVATLTVHAGAATGGCSLQAEADNNSASFLIRYQGAVYAGGATHVWTPLDGGRFEVDSSWVRVSDGAADIPGAADRVYIARNAWNNFPVLFGPRALAGIEMESGTQFELGGYALTVSGDISATNASIQDGPVTVRGRSQVTGSIGELTLGAEGCSGDELTVANLNTDVSMRLACRTSVGANVTGGELLVLPGAKLVMGSPASTLTFNHADVQGDSLTLDGQFNINSYAVLRPAALSMAPTSYLYTGGNLQLGENGNGSVALAGRIYVQGNLSQQGTGSSVADTITVVGTADWSGNRFEFTRGVLNLAQDLNVPAVHTSQQFIASGDHLTRLIGSGAQSVSMAYGGSGSNLARVRVMNQSGPVTIQTSITGGTTDSLALEITAGARLTYLSYGLIGGNILIGDSGQLTFSGDNALPSWAKLFLQSGSTWTVNGAFIGTCTFIGDVNTGPTVNGIGSIHGVSPTPAACGYIPPA